MAGKLADLAEATLQRRRLTLTLADGDGQEHTFEVRPITMRAGGKIQAFIAQQGPPDATAKVLRLIADSPGIAEEVQKEWLREARFEDRSWPPQFHTNPPAALAAVLDAPGGAEFLMATILEDSSDLKAERARQFVPAIDRPTFDAILETALGSVAETPVRADSCSLVLLGPAGLEMLVRGVVATLGVDVAPEQVDVAVAATKGAADRFGTLIPLVVEGGKAEAPKGRPAPRRDRST